MIRLFEFAENKKEIERHLTNQTDIIVEHILYLIMDKDNNAVDHWKNEIYSFLHTVKKLSGKNKFPTAKQIYDWTYCKISDCITDMRWVRVFVEDACDKEGFTYTSISSFSTISKQLDSFCRDYFSWLGENLSKVGIVSKQNVFKELDKLMRQYSL